MKRLLDDDLTTRPLSVVFYLLGGSGQIEGHALRRERAKRMLFTVGRHILTFAWGLYLGWLIRGG